MECTYFVDQNVNQKNGQTYLKKCTIFHEISSSVAVFNPQVSRFATFLHVYNYRTNIKAWQIAYGKRLTTVLYIHNIILILIIYDVANVYKEICKITIKCSRHMFQL